MGAVRVNGSTSGYVELNAPAIAGTSSLVLPKDSIQPGIVLISENSFSSVSTVSVNNCFTSTYINYRVTLNLSSASNYLNIRMRANGVDNSSSNYTWNGMSVSDSTTTSYNAFRTLGYTNFIQPLTTAATSGQSIIDIFNPQLTDITFFTIIGAGTGTTDMSFLTYGGRMSVTTSYDGFSLFPASGTISGTLRVYGYRNSVTT